MKAGNLPAKSHPMETMSSIMTLEAARSLDLLQAIDGTVEALVFTRRNMDALTEACESLLARAVTEDISDEPLERGVIPSLKQVQGYLQASQAVLSIRLRFAQNAPELDTDDGVVEAYEQVIASIVGLTSKVGTLMGKVNERLALSQMTPLERKMARNRSPLLSQEALDSVARSNAALLIDLGKTSRAK